MFTRTRPNLGCDKVRVRKANQESKVTRSQPSEWLRFYVFVSLLVLCEPAGHAIAQGVIAIPSPQESDSQKDRLIEEREKSVQRRS